jgi:hypothetical protein
LVYKNIRSVAWDGYIIFLIYACNESLEGGEDRNMNILKIIFSNPTYAGMAGMVLFATMFSILAWLAVSSKHQKQK